MEKHVVSLFSTLDNILIVQNVCEINVSGSNLSTTANSKCHICNNNFFTSKGLTDQKILDPIDDLSVIFN